MNEREAQFAEEYTKRTGFELVFEPAYFKIHVDGIDFSYKPDFYCPHTLTFFEVVGSRQAFHQDKFKIEAFKRAYPQLKFEIVDPDGETHVFNGLSYRNEQPVPSGYPIPKYLRERDAAMRRFAKAIDGDGIDYQYIAAQTGIAPNTLYRAVCGKTKRFNLETSKALNRYFESIEQQAVNA